jgi:hypothetical protein
MFDLVPSLLVILLVYADSVNPNNAWFVLETTSAESSCQIFSYAKCFALYVYLVGKIRSTSNV